MTIQVTVTTPDNKKARVTHGADVHTVEPGSTRQFTIHDGNPTLTILEQPADGESANRSGGGGKGDPDLDDGH